MSETIVLEVIGSSASAEAALARTGASAETMGRRVKGGAEESAGGLEKNSKAAEHNESASKGLASGLGGLVGAFAVVEVVRGVTDAYAKNEFALTSLQSAMHQAGEKETPAFTAALRNAQKAGEDMGFAQGDVTASITALRIAGVDTGRAMAAQGTIMDFARAKNIDMATATTAVVRGMQGSAKALKDLNMQMPPALVTTAQLAHAQDASAKAAELAGVAFQKYSDTAAKYGETSKPALKAQAAYEAAVKKSQDALARYHEETKKAGDRTKNLGIVLDDLGSKLGGSAKKHAEDSATRWEILRAKFNDVAGQAVPVLLNALNMLANTLGTLIEHANIVVPIMGVMLGAFVAFKVVGLVTTLFGELSKAVTGLGIAFKFLADNPIILVLAAIIAVGALLEAKFHWIETAVRVLGPTFETIGRVAGQVFGNIVNFFTGAFIPAIINIGKVVGTIFGVIWTVVSAVATPILAIIGLLVSIYVTYLQILWKVVSTVFGAMVTAIKWVIGPISTVIGWIVSIGANMFAVGGKIFGVLGNIAGWLGSVLGQPIGWLVNTIWTIGQTFAKVASWVFGVMGGIAGWLNDHIIKPIHDALGWIGNLAGSIGDVFSGKAFGIGQPQHHATGGQPTPGGLTWVGENGPELVRWPTGPSGMVIPAQQSARMAGGPGGKNVNVTVNAATNADPYAISRAVAWEVGLSAQRI